MWKRLNLTDERLRGGMYSTRILLGDRCYLKVSNKLVKRDGYGTALLYKEGFTFDLYHIEYGRFGKRSDVFERKVHSAELEGMFAEWIPEEPLPLPVVTGRPLEELLDE